MKNSATKYILTLSHNHENKLHAPRKMHLQADDRDPGTAMNMPTELDLQFFLGSPPASGSGAEGRQASAVYQRPVVLIVEKQSSLPRRRMPESEERQKKNPKGRRGSWQSRQDEQRLGKTGG